MIFNSGTDKTKELQERIDGLIDDTQEALDKTYSSQKISTDLQSKVDYALAVMVDENGRTYIDDGEDDA